MSKILVTGGTVFVSKFVAEYFVEKQYEVYVLNRNSRPQVNGVHLIEGDRHDPDLDLKKYDFDIVLDITSYNGQDITDLVSKIGKVKTYIFVSSSSVYPENLAQPFMENAELGPNKFWEKYGTDKIDAEKTLLDMQPDAYILRPPYLYGPGNNVYREAFVFDCAIQDRKFYLPRNGEMKLQFFHVRDLCKIMEKIIKESPDEHIYNVGNRDSVSIKEWVDICYKCAGKTASYVNVFDDIEQRMYFSFYDYEYALDVEKQSKILPDTISLEEGLKECYEWYKGHEDEVRKKPMIEYIDSNLK